MAWNFFQQKLERVEQYISERMTLLPSYIKQESEKTHGLIIEEAYYGLAWHIYYLENGLYCYDAPKDPMQYANN